jgi:ribonuclease Z
MLALDASAIAALNLRPLLGRRGGVQRFIMLTTVQAGPYTITGVSVAGLHTSLYVRELGALFDVGMALRSCAGAEHVFVSHAHADHTGALVTLLGMRGLMRMPPPRVYMPAEIASNTEQALALLSRNQRHAFALEVRAMLPGDEQALRADLMVRAFRTHHTGPSLGYQFFNRVQKLRREFLSLSGSEIAERRKRGDDLFDWEERLELAYATDTLIRVIDTTPSLLDTRVLILECSFLDERKDIAASQAGGHIHLDELLERADAFRNEALVLMHFSQMYSPGEVHRTLQRRCPAHLWERIVVFAPSKGPWPG